MDTIANSPNKSYLVLIQQALDHQTIEWRGLLTISKPGSAESLLDLTISDQPSMKARNGQECEWNITISPCELAEL